MNVRFFCWLLIGALTGPAAVRGQTAADSTGAGREPSSPARTVLDTSLAGPLAPDTTYLLPGVTVTAARMPVPGRESPIRVRRIDRAEIERSGAADLGELLGRRSGAFVRRNGPTGLAGPSLRGTHPSQSVLLLDGQPLGHPQIGQVDLSLLPATLMSSVEIAHGASSSLYGSRGLGGAVNVRTRTPAQVPTAQLRTRWGAFGARSAAITSSGRAGSVGALGALRVRTREGDFPYRNEALVPPRTVRRRNADRTDLSAFARLTGLRAEDPWALNAWVGRTERGVPGPATGAPSPARQTDRHLRLWGEAPVRPYDHPTRLHGFLQHQAIRYRDSARGLDETGRTWTVSTGAESLWSPGDGHRVTGGVSARYARARHPSLPNAVHRPQASTHLSARLAAGALLLYPSVRLDAYFPSGSEHPFSLPVSPQLGLNLQPLETVPLRWKARFGRAYRVPTLNDRYWVPGGNPELVPERGWTVDTGLHYGTSALRAEVSAFRSVLRDRIEWRPTAEGHWAPRNVGRTRTFGVESSLRLRIPLGARTATRLELAHTWTRARDRTGTLPSDRSSAAHPVRYVPDHRIRARGLLRVGPAELTLVGRYVGRRYVTTDGTESLEPYLRADAGLRAARRWARLRVRADVRAENVLDTPYAVLQGYPMPPRHLEIALTVSWLASAP